MMSIRTDLRAVRTIAVALAVTAIAAPTALARIADVHPQQRLPASPPTGSAAPAPATRDQTAGPRPVVHPNPDEQLPPTAPVAPILGAPRASDLGAIDRAQAREARASSYSPPPTARYSSSELIGVRPPAVSAPTIAAPGDGFQWGDAAVGAAVSAAIVLLVTAGTLAVRRRSQPTHS
jgi:hypothetical protein